MNTRPTRSAKISAIKRICGEDSDDDLAEDKSSDENDLFSDADDPGSEIHVDEANDINSISEDSLSVMSEEDLQGFYASDSSESDNNNIDEDILAFKSPSGREWNLIQPGPVVGRQPRRNIFAGRHGVHNGIHPATAAEAFLMYFEDIIEESTRFTNLEGRRITSHFNHVRSRFMRPKRWRPVSGSEMKAFYGMHILGGLFKARHRSLDCVWSERDGIPAYRAAMSQQRFKQIKRCFRVDDRTKRDTNDPLSPVRYVWSLLDGKLRAFYTPCPYLTIDEQLIEYHGSVKFRVYIPSKPGAYGMKIIWLNEADTGYALKGLPYIGDKTLTEEEKSGMTIPEASTMKLLSPYLGKGYNVTCDNWFTTSKLADMLVEKHTSLVGTVRFNRRDIPPHAKNKRDRLRKSALYYSSGHQILCSYLDKKTNPIILLSTMHTSAETGNVDGLPEMVHFYNKTKGGTDSMDHMVRLYRSGRKCRRWPYTFVFNMVDIALLNSCILYRKSLPQQESERKSNLFRFDFCMKVAYELMDAHIKQRMVKQSELTSKARAAIRLLGYNFQNTNISSQVLTSTNRKRSGRCTGCSRINDKKTTQYCSECTSFVCKEHSLTTIQCLNCIQSNN